jgi:hypothetical protein
MSLMLTVNQLNAIFGISCDDDSYLDIESKVNDDISLIKVNFFNEDDEKSQDYFIDQEGNEIGEEEYNK